MLTYLDYQIELHLGDARDVVPKLGRRFPVACFDAPDTVIVDRTSKWGNLFKMGSDLPGMPGQAMDTEDACQCFESFTIPELPAHELAGKDLACWCALDAPCHADVLLKYATRCTADKGGDALKSLCPSSPRRPIVPYRDPKPFRYVVVPGSNFSGSFGDRIDSSVEKRLEHHFYWGEQIQNCACCEAALIEQRNTFRAKLLTGFQCCQIVVAIERVKLPSRFGFFVQSYVRYCRQIDVLFPFFKAIQFISGIPNSAQVHVILVPLRLSHGVISHHFTKFQPSVHTAFLAHVLPSVECNKNGNRSGDQRLPRLKEAVHVSTSTFIDGLKLDRSPVPKGEAESEPGGHAYGHPKRSVCEFLYREIVHPVVPHANSNLPRFRKTGKGRGAA